MPGTALRESMALLLTRRFGTFWFASLLSNIGTWAQQVAEPWLLLSLGASSVLVGLDSFVVDVRICACRASGKKVAASCRVRLATETSRRSSHRML
jgi:hypothetical protein